MPGWWKAALLVSGLLVVFTGLKRAKDEGIIKDEVKP